ncbi:hypothetical protein EYF80_007358 [Liparis tanakae]|uniref:Uncharacterized protein n=1 Tax=Liparis tanakae TaxID=230148 RepID=A0A4Z2IZA1_9TELE|nr:hypothetical protein EYF80_007358 [Liparis tanakae]
MTRLSVRCPECAAVLCDFTMIDCAGISGTGNLHQSMNLVMLLSMVVPGVVVHGGAEHAAHCAGPSGTHPSSSSSMAPDPLVNLPGGRRSMAQSCRVTRSESPRCRVLFVTPFLRSARFPRPETSRLLQLRSKVPGGSEELGRAESRLPCGQERELYSGAPGFMWGNQKQQVMETAGPVGWLWPGGSGKMEAFIYCPCLPARITSSNKKQMSSSTSECNIRYFMVLYYVEAGYGLEQGKENGVVSELLFFELLESLERPEEAVTDLLAPLLGVELPPLLLLLFLKNSTLPFTTLLSSTFSTTYSSSSDDEESSSRDFLPMAKFVCETLRCRRPMALSCTGNRWRSDR